ncbi:MAG: bifunctional UDP-N-acetylglucosamine diphosphorylase/glucosamine-1-phosphate N-acetyltransferase GlmU [Peptococcaceae bacterium]|nr:bifunctional UDP-N-acetylglucosamine diphosphorylase/glucosamine-1-phosphate N-acetyltransferase GlmU [Peptococcaceae bacterium]
MNSNKVTGLVLAAGKGTRMKSAIPKVMHDLAGRPLIGHVLASLNALEFTKILVVVGHGREQVTEYISQAGVQAEGGNLDIIVQRDQLGTAHAVQQALPYLPEGTVMVLSGDQPLLALDTLGALLETHRRCDAAATVLTAEMEDPSGLGRIVRGEGGCVARIVEQKDADAETQHIKEINTGTYCFQVEALRQALAHVRPNNVQQEYYLTDVFGYLTQKQRAVAAHKLTDPQEAMGINDLYQLSVAEEIYWERMRRYWMREGVRMVRPSTILIEGDVTLEADVTLLPNTWLRGRSYIGRGSVIGPQTTLDTCRCGEKCVIECSVAEEAVLGNGCHVGPFGRLRKGSVLENDAHVGNFVEIKNSIIGRASKASHLSYIGDAELGERVNVGAGTITCNYDGAHKHKTLIGDGVFVGSNANLVAPVSIGAGATIGAGSTVTKDVPAEALALERADQRMVSGWKTKIGVSKGSSQGAKRAGKAEKEK